MRAEHSRGAQGAGQGPSPDDPFVVLGVTPTATLAEIRAAKRRLVQECHPDRVTGAGLGGRLRDLAEAEMKRINCASDEAEQRARLRPTGTSR
ncbi:MAG: hypothetical protein EPO40_17565 [Myxococcaceae bacterium]|nr:MAG: hypothetical protein EPO40_17565 [Myxococcaceae bacterium]